MHHERGLQKSGKLTQWLVRTKEKMTGGKKKKKCKKVHVVYAIRTQSQTSGGGGGGGVKYLKFLSCKRMSG